jgi:hypothetical protein
MPGMMPPGTAGAHWAEPRPATTACADSLSLSVPLLGAGPGGMSTLQRKPSVGSAAAAAPSAGGGPPMETQVRVRSVGPAPTGMGRPR